MKLFGICHSLLVRVFLTPFSDAGGLGSHCKYISFHIIISEYCRLFIQKSNTHKMAGAIAGTAIIKTGWKHETLNTVSLTINNACNMSCGHCYLQYKSDNTLISDGIVESVLNNDFSHLAIVGKEPLVNNSSIEKLCSIIEKCAEKGISVSFITNGINLSHLPIGIIPLINYIDVSFDGGFESYKNYRKGDIVEILDGIRHCLEHGLKEVNALHTICNQTMEFVPDCIRLKEYIPFKTILFTPYLSTINYGENTVSPLPLLEVIKKMDNDDTFNNSDEASLLIDNYHIEQNGLSIGCLENALAKVSNKGKYLVYKDDPVFYGIIRVTYDGFILSPRQSLNTRLYRDAPRINSHTNLNELFRQLSNQELKIHGS